MLIAIPSKSRPYKLKSKELLKNAVIFVPDNEYLLYKKIYNEIIAVPKYVKGITQTRNFILKEYQNENIVFVDDDLIKCGYWIDKDNSNKRKFINIKDGEIIINEFEKLFELTASLNYKIWGLKTESSKISQNDEKPFLFKTYLTASCMGIINDDNFYFDETYLVKEDYEYGLRAIEKYGGVLGARYFSWENEHWKTKGGCNDYRTDEIEEQCIKKLIKQYPKYVKRANRKNSKYCIELNF